MPAKAVAVRSLTKHYGRIKALRGVSFEVDRGELFGIIGPNGAGKSTLLRILATLLVPTSGTARIFNHDVVEEPDSVRRLISYLPEEAGAYRNLKGREYLRFMARLYSRTPEEYEEMLRRGTELSGLGRRLNETVSTYSKGMTRRLLLARALMVNPRLAILDEPTSGLDVVNAYAIRRVIKSIARERGVTFLISSHNMLEVEYLCERVALIHRGSLVEIGTPGELKERFDAENLEEVFIKSTGHTGTPRRV